MHRVVSHNTVFPTRIDPRDYFAMPIIEDYMSLKPKPEKDVLLITGDTTGLLKDIEAWYEIAEGVVEYDTMAVNYSALIIPHPIQHYAAGDAHTPDMQAVAKKLPKDVVKHAWNPGCVGFDVRWIRNGRGGWNGTSANLAFSIGLALDYAGCSSGPRPCAGVSEGACEVDRPLPARQCNRPRRAGDRAATAEHSGQAIPRREHARVQGTTAGIEVVRAAPDGQTLLFTSNTAIASNVPLIKKMPYDPTRDFAPVAGIGDNCLVLMVKVDLPAKDLREFIAYARQRPGKLAAS